jgi:zinc protease
MNASFRASRIAALLVCLAATCVGAAPAPISAGADRIVERTLANGMKIVVWPDQDIRTSRYPSSRSAAATGMRVSPASLLRAHDVQGYGTGSGRVRSRHGRGGGSNSNEKTGRLQDWFPASTLS